MQQNSAVIHSVHGFETQGIVILDDRGFATECRVQVFARLTRASWDTEAEKCACRSLPDRGCVRSKGSTPPRASANTARAGEAWVGGRRTLERPRFVVRDGKAATDRS
jgi:hypothetical protein